MNITIKRPTEKETESICFVCNKPIPSDDIHWVHEPGCWIGLDIANGKDVIGVCDCNLSAHPECCPFCKESENEPVIETGNNQS